MRTKPINLIALALAVVIIPPRIARAQSSAPVSVTDSTAPAAPVQKKKGMFGKMKGLAKSKVVNTVAKAALCTAVPGGQVIASAMDARKAKNAAGAAGAAAGLAGGGGNCMPGMAGIAAKGAVAPASGSAALAGVAGGAIPSMPTSGVGGPGMSPAQLKAMQKQYQQMGMDSAQVAAMQQMMNTMPGAPATSTEPSTAAQPQSLGPALSREKGRMIMRQLPWMPGSEAIKADGGPPFGLAIREIAQTMGPGGTRFTVQARVEEQGSKTRNRDLARRRAAAVITALTAEGIAKTRLTVSDGGADKDVRIVISGVK
jgi:outer membrane protein OmpA-like peptidoglycan-associated protein